MEDFGARASDNQWNDISAYLIKHFSKINVNRAAATDFEVVLDVDAKRAESIVSYRTEHGNFATLDDLKKVPGIDATTVDARAKRLTF
jgi:competence protein ComEA